MRFTQLGSLIVTFAVLSPFVAFAQIPTLPLSPNSPRSNIVVPPTPTSTPQIGFPQPYAAAASEGVRSCVRLARNLSIGSRGPEVLQVQQYFFSQNLLASDSATGYFGRLTEAAVQQWQSSHGVVSSGTAATTGYGVVGPKTRAALALACSGTSASVNTNQSLIDSLLAQVKVLQDKLAQLIAAKGGGGESGSSSVPPITYTYPPSTSNISTNSNTAPASCTWNGGTVASGSSIAAYQSSSVAYGSQCIFEQRSCTNGTLSGSYTNPSCSIASNTTTNTTAASCSFNSQTIANGSSVTAYQSSSVAYGSSCQFETRTCTNGTLSGSYANASCSVAAATSFKMADYWTRPGEGKQVIKNFAVDIEGDSPWINHVQQHVKTGDSYKITDYIQWTYRGEGYPYYDTWHVRITPQGDVIEYRDQVGSADLVYLPGFEIKWGNTFKVGDSVEGQLKVDIEKSIGFSANSPGQYGYNKITLVAHHPTLVVGGETYTDVLEFSLWQSFCKTTACEYPTGMDIWSQNYFFAPGQGIIKTVFYQPTPAVSYLYLACTTIPPAGCDWSKVQ